jgi:hypothetical protein
MSRQSVHAVGGEGVPLLLDEEVLTFRLWPPPDERRESVERDRIVQPAVEWRWKPLVLARTASS